MAEKEEERRTMAEQPHWQPIAMLATIARHIDGMVEADEEQLTTLQEARTRPYVLDDYTGSRVKRAFTTKPRGFLGLRGATAPLACTQAHYRATRRGRPPPKPDDTPSPNQQRRARPGRGVEQRHD